MRKIKRSFFIKEKGLTLVEVLASIVIILIILIFFLSIFIQTAKTNETSEKIVDATYIAQTEMERFYGYSKTVEKSNRVNILKDVEGYTYEFVDSKEVYKINRDSYEIVVTLNDNEDLTNILIEVFDTSGKKVAQMQNIVEWSADDEE